MNKKLNRNSSAGTAADSDKMPKLTTSSHHIAKPNVVCSQSQVHAIKNAFTDKDDFWIEYSSKSPPFEKR